MWGECQYIALEDVKHNIQKRLINFGIEISSNLEINFGQAYDKNFDIERINNNENLTFGIGGHMCLAKYFSIHLATEALWHLFQNYKFVSLLENQIQYESLINARLPKRICIQFNN